MQTPILERIPLVLRILIFASRGSRTAHDPPPKPDPTARFVYDQKRDHNRAKCTKFYHSSKGLARVVELSCVCSAWRETVASYGAPIFSAAMPAPRREFLRIIGDVCKSAEIPWLFESLVQGTWIHERGHLIASLNKNFISTDGCQSTTILSMLTHFSPLPSAKLTREREAARLEMLRCFLRAVPLVDLKNGDLLITAIRNAQAPLGVIRLLIEAHFAQYNTAVAMRKTEKLKSMEKYPSGAMLVAARCNRADVIELLFEVAGDECVQNCENDDEQSAEGLWNDDQLMNTSALATAVYESNFDAALKLLELRKEPWPQHLLTAAVQVMLSAKLRSYYRKTNYWYANNPVPPSTISAAGLNVLKEIVSRITDLVALLAKISPSSIGDRFVLEFLLREVNRRGALDDLYRIWFGSELTRLRLWLMTLISHLNLDMLRVAVEHFKPYSLDALSSSVSSSPVVIFAPRIWKTMSGAGLDEAMLGVIKYLCQEIGCPLNQQVPVSDNAFAGETLLHRVLAVSAYDKAAKYVIDKLKEQGHLHEMVRTKNKQDRTPVDVISMQHIRNYLARVLAS